MNSSWHSNILQAIKTYSIEIYSTVCKLRPEKKVLSFGTFLILHAGEIYGDFSRKETQVGQKRYLYLYGILSFAKFFDKEAILHFSVTN